MLINSALQVTLLAIKVVLTMGVLILVEDLQTYSVSYELELGN